MTQITLKIKDGKLKFFLELIKNFDFVQIENDGDSNEAIITNLKKGLADAKLLQEGKLDTRPAKKLLNEL